MSKIAEAVKHAIDEIAIAQQNVAALRELDRRMTYPTYDSANVQHAQSVLWAAAHVQLVRAWERLSYFAPISEVALELLRKRTHTMFRPGTGQYWFARADTGIMSFLGFTGSYYTADEEQFRREVLAIFGCEGQENGTGPYVDEMAIPQYCGKCGELLQVVRPGKWQCNTCGI